jgi:phenylpropionate dioxygenase-like ring-hydroxylating dioxygenase large terminal subunit
MKMTTSQRRSAGTRRKSKDGGIEDWRTWPHYEAAHLGLQNFWYPVAWASDLSTRPYHVTVCGQPTVLMNDGGKLYALHDRCPHRGVKLSEGKQEFPGTVSCPYHGWTFELGSGRLCAAIPDGPDSPIVGRVGVRTYPVQEHLGIAWLFIGDGDPTSLHDQLPDELTGSNLNVVVGGRITPHRYGNWRFGAENGFDEGHARYLHRDQLFMLFRQMPAWAATRVTESDDGRELFRVQERTEYEAEFPGLGRWPRRKKITQRSQRPGNPSKIRGLDPAIAEMDFPGNISIRLPGVIRVVWKDYIHYEFHVPEDEDHHRYVQLVVQWGGGPRGALFRFRYWAYLRWLFHGLFTARDAWMVEEMDAPPERLFRPDVSITRWRRLVETHETRAEEAVSAATPNSDSREA